MEVNDSTEQLGLRTEGGNGETGSRGNEIKTLLDLPLGKNTLGKCLPLGFTWPRKTCYGKLSQARHIPDLFYGPVCRECQGRKFEVLADQEAAVVDRVALGRSCPDRGKNLKLSICAMLNAQQKCEKPTCGQPEFMREEVFTKGNTTNRGQTRRGKGETENRGEEMEVSPAHPLPVSPGGTKDEGRGTKDERGAGESSLVPVSEANVLLSSIVAQVAEIEPVSLIFAEYPELLDFLRDMAKRNYRTPELQLLALVDSARVLAEKPMMIGKY